MQNKVLDYFQQLCTIPHASHDEGKIGQWLMDFAKQRKLECRRDEAGNVIIKKSATVPGCKAPAVMLQGHMDMVYVRTPDCKYAYEDGIKPVIKDGFISADGTSLGADDGMALAYALAVLDSDELAHPDLEAVFTVQEETSLGGAEAIDCSDLKAKYLINIDTEQEGVFCTSCAGAVRNDMTFPLSFEKVKGLQKLTVKIGGLMGGHSGMEIQLGRPNAIMLMFSALLSFGGQIHIASISCDGKTNAIATDCEAVIYVDPEKTEKIISRFAKLEGDFNTEFAGKDTVRITVETGEIEDAQCWDSVTHRAALGAYVMLPNGVLNMSEEIEGLVETSSNPGIVKQTEDTITVSSCVRSSVTGRKECIMNRLDTLAGMAYGECTYSGDYPMWEYNPDSKLREIAMQSYEELFGKKPTAAAIHAGLECGYFAEKMPGIDIISFGPDQFEVHTTRERADIASVDRVWLLLVDILAKLSK